VLHRRARGYSRDCGCAAGAAFLGAASVSIAAYVAVTGDLRVWTALAAVGVVFAASAAGKLAGLLVASVRLARLHRSLTRRLRVVHVDVH
jgi:hypothetical protein